MNKIIIVISLLLFSYTVNAAEADTDSAKSVALKIGLPGSIMFEGAVSEKLSLGLEIAGARAYPESLSYSYGPNGGGIVNARAVGARVSWQPKGAFKRGAYLSGWVDYLSFDYEDFGGGMSGAGGTPSTTGSGTTVAAGVAMGYQYLWEKSDLSVSIGAGYGIIKGASFNGTQTTSAYDAQGMLTSQSSKTINITTKTTDAFMFDLYIGFLF
jgi:hypothetical protein